MGIGYGFGLGPFGVLVIAALLVLPFWRICTKAGFPGIVALLVLVPLVNVMFIYWLAFVDWPGQQPETRPPTSGPTT